jgi:hypothetical protein
MKMMRWLILTVLFACLLCACAAPVEEPEPTTTVPEETTQITEPVTEEVTEPHTEPPVEVARDMIREGAYTDALDLLADVEGDEAQMLRLRAGLGDVAVGDEIAFGHFEQDNDTENGAEQIVWIVVGKEGDKALLLSKFCLDTQPFHSKNGSVTWEDSLMRSWLNGEFCDAAFAAAEQLFNAAGDGGGRRIIGDERFGRFFLHVLDQIRLCCAGERTEAAQQRGSEEKFQFHGIASVASVSLG